MLQQQARADTAQRWLDAAHRAQSEGVRVYQLQSSGAWVATSGRTRGVAYEIAVTDNVAHGCACPACEHGDPVCKHRAAFYLLVGALELPAPAESDEDYVARTQTEIESRCAECGGTGVRYDRNLERAGWLYPVCAGCAGSGVRR